MKKIFKRPEIKEEFEQHDRWMVSYADFITLLFAFFVVLYASSSINASKYEQLSASVGAAFNTKPDSRKAPVPSVVENVPLRAKEDAIQQPTLEIITAAEKEMLVSGIDQLERNEKKLLDIIDQKNQDQLALQTSVIELQTSIIEFDHEIKRLEDQFEYDNKRLKGQLTVAEQKLQNATASNHAMQGGARARTDILNKVQRALSTQGIQIEVDTKNGLLRLPETLLFDSGKAEFRNGGDNALKVVARNLALFLNCYTQISNEVSPSDPCDKITDGSDRHAIDSVLIEGHTDALPISNSVFRDNWDLSVARAKNTYLELIKNEKSLENLENDKGQPLVSFSAYAGRRPISTNDSEAERRKNRRIDIRLIMAPPSFETSANSLTRISQE
jgi:flagellar motor protein MotB